MKILFFFFIITLSGFAQDSTSTYDPCKDPQLIKLQLKDSLSASETNLYIELTKLCDDKTQASYGPSKQRSKDDESIKKQRDDYRDSRQQAYDAFTAYYILAAIGLIISLVYLISI